MPTQPVSDPSPSNLASARQPIFTGSLKTGSLLWNRHHWHSLLQSSCLPSSKVEKLLKIMNASYGSGVPTRSKPDARSVRSHIHRPVPFTSICFSHDISGPVIQTNAAPLNVSHSTRRRDKTESRPSSLSMASASQPPPHTTWTTLNYILGAVDQRGHIYAFDLHQNTFMLVGRCGVSGTCISFNTIRRRELIVGLSDHSLQCYNIDTGHLIARLPAYHSWEPRSICVHPSKALALTSSRSESLLWNTEAWTRIRVLAGGDSLIVQQASFSPNGSSIVSCFSDGSILLWSLESFSLSWKISLDQLDLQPSSALSQREFLLVDRTSCMAQSHDSELIVYAALPSALYVWSASEKRLLHELVIPAFKDQLFYQIEFIAGTKLVVVLTDHGEIAFVDVLGGALLGQLHGKDSFKSFCISRDGRYITAIMEESRFVVQVLRIDSIWSHFKIKLRTAEGSDRGEEEGQSISESGHQNQLDESEGGSIEDTLERAPVKKHTPTVKVADQPETFYELVESKHDSSIMNRAKLAKFLHHYGVYPDKYRILIWRFLLRLPENYEAYQALMQLGPHPVVKEFRRKFPLKSERLNKSMEKVLSALAHWTLIIENLEYMPALIFPFVKLFSNDIFTCFEVLVTLVINWCQKWWDYYPNPPIEILDVVEDLLAYHDPELVGHFVKWNITSQIYAWIMIQTFFSENFSKDEWLRVWDHFVTSEPAFMYHFLVAYLRSFRVSLMAITKVSDYKHFFTRRNAVNLTAVLDLAYSQSSNTPPQICPTSFLATFEPTLKGQTRMRERIREEEEAYLRKRMRTDEVSRLVEELRRDKREWENSDWKMNEMLEKWWSNMMDEQENHQLRKAKLDALEKEQRSRAVQRIIQARSSFVDHQNSSITRHMANISKTVGFNRRALEFELDQAELDEKFSEIENEWLKRREDMIKKREELAKLDQERIERMIKQAHKLGVRDGEFEDELRKRLNKDTAA
ncbi:uncharacterized protein BJ171DRAFT_509794 [Polychytrium aggregatum]|uniref:uncharacterized protein n=1 Tax=Polychytrium aggregatum TaxID=110093 RepID=UPI0022FF0750|nr:uncharacterized protein BJ171DRAFT_509794 [Polychytrium aggregatum]KAI9203502.1 hypothetical protein BJ171DRAFT_509794 [Polychytrium aggregatum]